MNLHFQIYSWSSQQYSRNYCFLFFWQGVFYCCCCLFVIRLNTEIENWSRFKTLILCPILILHFATLFKRPKGIHVNLLFLVRKTSVILKKTILKRVNEECRKLSLGTSLSGPQYLYHYLYLSHWFAIVSI